MKLLRFLSLVLFIAIPGAIAARAAGDFDETHQFVFHAVLEGCYDDGLSNEDVAQILLHEKNGGYVHFIYACPLCTPTIHALQAYESRPRRFSGMKTSKNTFGPGLGDELKTQLFSSKPKDRLTAINTLVHRWISKRIALLRLTDAEQARLNEKLKQMRGRGNDLLKGALKDARLEADQFMATFKDIQQCAVCNGACGMSLQGK